MWSSRWRCVIKPAYSVSFLLSINIFVWQNVLYFLDAPRTIILSLKHWTLWLPSCLLWSFLCSLLAVINKQESKSWMTSMLVGLVGVWTNWMLQIIQISQRMQKLCKEGGLAENMQKARCKYLSVSHQNVGPTVIWITNSLKMGQSSNIWEL